MALYTFNLEYKGFTSVQQSTGSTLKQALENWAHAFVLGNASGLPSNRKEIAMSLSKASPTPVSGVRNVWCVTGQVDSKLALMNIILTRE